MKKLCERIIEQRNRLGLSQESLAEQLGIGRRTVIRYESGETIPTGDALVKLCSLFSVSSDYLLGIIDTPRHIVVDGDSLTIQTEKGDSVFPEPKASASMKVSSFDLSSPEKIKAYIDALVEESVNKAVDRKLQK